MTAMDFGAGNLLGALLHRPRLVPMTVKAALRFVRQLIWTVAVEGLRQAIKLGRHEGLMIDNLFHERREKLRELECANGQ